VLLGQGALDLLLVFLACLLACVAYRPEMPSVSR
jgi:hypothetical protein